MDTYLTIGNTGESEYEEKHSRFLGLAQQCESEEQAAAILNNLRSECWDARHVVYAYRLRDGSARFSDDGEPHGTAGKPVMDTLNGSGLTDVIVTVVRHFGGILLGTGGLVHAYSTAARDALQNAERVEMALCTRFEIKIPYSDHQKFSNLLHSSGSTIEDTEFSDIVRIVFSVRRENMDELRHLISENFSGRLVPEEKESSFAAFSLEK